MSQEMSNEQKNDIFVTRSPIFDKSQNVYAYELLFRSNCDNFFNQVVSHEHDSSETLMESFAALGLRELKREKKALINLTPKSLFKASVYAVPKGEIIVELPKTIEPDISVISICKRLEKHGYVLALDEFVFEEKYAPLLSVVDIVRIELNNGRGNQWKTLPSEKGNGRIKFLAHNIETKTQFDEAAVAGFTYFQGDFFSNPDTAAIKELPSSKHNLLILLKELMAPDLSLDKIETVLKHDVSLSFKLLKFINSAAFGFFKCIKSIRHAINLMGISEFKKWMSVIVLSQIGVDKPDEITIESITRAKLCESIAGLTTLSDRKADAFLMGMFSLIDVLVGRQMEEVLALLPLADDIKAALEGKPNELRDILDLVVKYEKADWPSVDDITKRIAFPIDQLPRYYFEAVDWANYLERE
ncbi:MAG: HDOD domain-containing protein [bacterium]|nr:HDOD domain-containing protein [bacterium]